MPDAADAEAAEHTMTFSVSSSMLREGHAAAATEDVGGALYQAHHPETLMNSYS